MQNPQSQYKFKATITFVDNFWLKVETDPYTNSFIRKYFTVTKEGAWFAPSYRTGQWDGNIYFYTAANKLPIGLLKELVDFLNLNNIDVYYTNARQTLQPQTPIVGSDFLPNLTLRPYQIEGINICLKEGMGIVKVATGGGKTVMICAVLKAYNPILGLIVANQINLVMQMRDRLISYGFDQSKIGIIYGGQKDYKDKQFVFSTIQSIMNYPEIYKYAEVLIVDECFDKDTRILLPDNKCVRIKDIYENESIDSVISYNHEKNIYEPKKVIHRFRKENLYKWYFIKIKSENNKITTLKVTENHKIWTADGYKTVKDLKLSDILKFNTSDPKLYNICKVCGKLVKYIGFHNYTEHPTEEQKKIKDKSYDNRSKNDKWKTSLSSHMKKIRSRNNEDEKARCKKIIIGNKKYWNENPNKVLERKKNFINAPRYNKYKNNKLEQSIIDLQIPEIKFTGNGKCFIELNFYNYKKKCFQKDKNPDFIIKNEKKVIETVNSTYWHNEEEINEIINKYNENGYKCLFLRDVLDFDKIKDRYILKEESKNRLLKFVYNHEAHIVPVTKWKKPYITKKIGSDKYQYNIEVEDNHNYFANNVLVSNCKHSEAATYAELSKKTGALVKLGFDATPFTYDDRCTDMTVKKSIGDIIYEKTTRDLIDLGHLVRPLIAMMKINNEKTSCDYKTAYKNLIVNNTKRNLLIKNIVKKENGRILILIHHIEHGKNLMKLIPDATFLWGEIDSMERYNELQNFINSNEKYVLIGSTIFDEGIDFEKGIDAIIIASAGKSFRKTVQRLGRALRPNKKGYVNVYDFNDNGSKYLKEHSEQRKNIYEAEGHTVIQQS